MNKEELSLRINGLLRRLRSSPKAALAAAVVGIIGMLLILFSGGNESNEKKNETVGSDEFRVQEYSEELTQELRRVLSSIEGVGSTEIMITFGGSESYSYASDTKEDEGRKESEYVRMKSGSNEEPLLEKVGYPRVTGVIIVCQGGGSDRVRERVYEAVTTVFGIPSSRVCVEQME